VDVALWVAQVLAALLFGVHGSKLTPPAVGPRVVIVLALVFDAARPQLPNVVPSVAVGAVVAFATNGRCLVLPSA
jgi:hypothetical protein